MQMQRATRSAIALALLLTAMAFAQSPTNAPSVEIAGAVMPKPGGKAEFRSNTGTTYDLLRGKMSEALFADTNLHRRPLLLKGRALSNTVFEVTGNVRSIRRGQTNEVFYYCDICAIKQIEPGPCMCCREPVVLTEEPVK